MNRAAALGKNAVVNLSLGSLYGPKDGTSPFEAGLNALTGPGRIVVVAAGNSRGKPVHAEVIAAPGGSTQATFSLSSSAAGKDRRHRRLLRGRRWQRHRDADDPERHGDRPGWAR